MKHEGGDSMRVASSLKSFQKCIRTANLPFQIRSTSLETLHTLARSVDMISGSTPAAVIVRSTLRLRSVSV